MLGINGGEILFILVIAVIIIGPERLPQFAEQLARAVRKGKALFTEAKLKVDAEMGAELGDVDWAKLDPRQYDPRKIVRDTLLEDTPLDPQYEAKRSARSMGTATAGSVAGAPLAKGAGPVQGSASPYAGTGFDSYRPLETGQAAPFDYEAT